MIPILSLVTSIKDYIEVVHKLIESDSNFGIADYNELGSIITYSLISLKNSFSDFLSLNWRDSIWNLPVMIPDISSAMISEISVLDGYFHNTFNFLDTPLSYGPKNGFIYGLEKFMIGLINSCFLILPTTIAHIITLRRFVMQGLEAGYIAGLATIAGNIFWIGSIVLGFRFFVIPWVTLFSPLGYLLGFMLLIKYMWDSYNEKRMVLEDLSKQKIFILNFLLALTEQTNIYPFLTNLTISPESSILESFPAENYPQFMYIHLCYLLGLLVGSLSLLHFTCWFWENPAFKLYMWVISSFKVSTGSYSKFLNFFFLYLTMICAITSIPYYGLDYTITNPLGFVSDDRIIDQKLLPEVAFINSKASDKNTRRNRGRHGRRERWKRRVRKYRTFDASLYDQGVYDLFTIEDLNYGFDRFWLRRKMRNHRVRFRFFPGPWMRSFKKQLSKPRLESYAGPRQEFFRILFEQVYHPSFHKYNLTKKKLDEPQNLNLMKKNLATNVSSIPLTSTLQYSSVLEKKEQSIYSSLNYKNKGSNSNQLILTSSQDKFNLKENLIHENSTLRKFVRKVNNRIKTSQIIDGLILTKQNSESLGKDSTVYSKRWKEIFSKVQNKNVNENRQLNGLFKNFYTKALSTNAKKINKTYNDFPEIKTMSFITKQNIKKENSRLNLSQKDYQLLHYRSELFQKNSLVDKTKTNNLLLHPLTYYLKKDQAFQKKLNFYTPTIFRKFSIENNSPYFRVMMKRYFYYYKPTRRWEKTMKVASLRKARRKKSRIPRKLQPISNNTFISNEINAKSNQLFLSEPNKILDINDNDSKGFTGLMLSAEERLKRPTSTYTIVGKRASRYRYQIYKDVLQHWYYSPFNRFLVKLDVDSFIRRQPNSHFLTKNEENLVHLRRFLLSEHYNTLRWYTYMQHYRTMKTKIGGTKSFSSKVYNQQFQGTFKKIRHLFAITPSQSEKTILKFDQPLYNESYNTQNKNYLNTFLIHEELVDSYKDNNSLNDLVGQSTQIIREYLGKATPIRQEIIKKLISDHNYTELTQFLYKGQKMRGNQPITNNNDFYNQEKNYLLTSSEKQELFKFEKQQLQTYLHNNSLNNNLWINLLKKWKHRVNDQEFMKNYISRRVEKREKRKQKKERVLKTKLNKLTIWLNSVSQDNSFKSNKIKQTDKTLSSGLQKSINEGVLTLKSETNNILLSQTPKTQFITVNEETKLTSNKLNLNNLHFYGQLENERQIQASLSSIQEIVEKHNKNTGVLLNPNQKSMNVKNLLMKTKQLVQTYHNNITNYLGLQKLSALFLPVKQKSFNSWQKKERALNKQKKSRKEFKSLSQIITKKNSTKYKNEYYFNSSLEYENSLNQLRKKRDLNNQGGKSQWTEIWEYQYPENSNFVTKFFKRKKSPQRRARIRRSRGVTKKRTLADSLKREFRNLRRYGEKVDNASKKEQILEKINTYSFAGSQQKFSPEDEFQMMGQKQRRSKQRKQRTWKQKRSKYSQKLRKYRKRRRNVLGKIRILSKQLKRNQSKVQIQNWWWNNFLPNLRANTDALWQIEKDKQIREKLQEFNVPEILQRDNLNNSISKTNELINSLQIGDKDFKPLALPEALRLKDKLYPNQSNTFNTQNLLDIKTTNSGAKNLETSSLDLANEKNIESSIQNNNVIAKIYENVLLSNSLSSTNLKLTQGSFLTNNTTIPFYAGWDESLRKFVVTNRLLSRREAGFEMNLNSLKDSDSKIPGLNQLSSTLNSNTLNMSTNESRQITNLQFTKAPLKGMNAATTLYWQIPFTTYDPDQFFALGMDGFAPIGWRRFNFRHTILKSWLYYLSSGETYAVSNQEKTRTEKKPILVKGKTTLTTNLNVGTKTIVATNEKTNPLIYKLNTTNFNLTPFDNANFMSSENQNFKFKDNKMSKNLARRLKKRNKRVKKHPRAPVWFPSGPLLNQVLPVHYIYVFYKRSRVPRDRYLKRRLQNTKVNKTKDLNSTLSIGESTFKKGTPVPFSSSNNGQLDPSLVDYTLRKRVKTKRKYHRKKDLTKKMPIFPRRVKFLGEDIDSIQWRPMSRQKLNKSIGEYVREQRLLRSKQKQKELNKGNKQPSLRVKQLRRRVQRQIIRSVWRYRPRAGGFVWPGDYLRLELVKAPTLQQNLQTKFKETKETTEVSKGQRKMKRKKKRTLQEWQIQPKKYLLEKHNIRVLKKKLEKANRSSKIKQLKYSQLY